MKFDMHCHTKEGSIDAKVGVEEYVEQLISKGFDGMLVTDHNSYRGYRKWKKIENLSQQRHPFVVLKGVEYDTSDGGHMLAVLPDGVSCRLLEIRGLSVEKLERLVHHLGGILGPAHPYGTGFFALMNNRWVKAHKEIIERFDFIESFNSCTQFLSNKKAEILAEVYQKPRIGGSDAHKLSMVGTACTVFDRTISCNNDLIRAMKEHAKMKAGGTGDQIPVQKQNLFLCQLGIIGYWLYNKFGVLIRFAERKKELRLWKLEERKNLKSSLL